MNLNLKSTIYGVLSGLGILLLFIGILTFFQGYYFAIYEFQRLWPWLITLAAGFGTQIGLYFSIRCAPELKAGVSTSGAVSGGSMVVCCSHYLLNILPFIGLVGLSEFLMTYQKAFFTIGIVSSLVGISLMLKHKHNMRIQFSNSQEEKSSGEYITLNRKTLIFLGVIFILILLLLGTFSGFFMNSNSASTNSNKPSSNMPQKCIKPDRTSLEDWKSHLGHHADLAECFEYFR